MTGRYLLGGLKPSKILQEILVAKFQKYSPTPSGTESTECQSIRPTETPSQESPSRAPLGNGLGRRSMRSSDGQVFLYALQPLLRLLLIAWSAGSTQELHLALGVPSIIDSLDFDCEHPRLRHHTGQPLRVILWENRCARNRRASMATGSSNEETRPCLRLSAHRVATMGAPRSSCGCTQFNGETRLCRRSRTRRRNH